MIHRCIIKIVKEEVTTTCTLQEDTKMEAYEVIEQLKVKANVRLQDVPVKPLDNGGWKVYRKSLNNKREARTYCKAILNDMLEYIIKETNRAKVADSKGIAHKVDKGDFKQYRTGVKAEWSSDRMFNDSWLIGQMRTALVINKLFGLFDN